MTPPSGAFSESAAKRKPVTIDNTGNLSTLTNYQVSATVAYDSDMQTDFDDIRFTDSDGTTLIDHWLETKTDSVSATFWVEVPSLPGSANTTAYMYYGNSGASSASSGSNTFVFFDDAESGSATDKWETVEGSPAFGYEEEYAGNWYQDLTTGYHGPMATYTAMHRPTAVYAPSQDKTFFVYGSSGNTANIGYFDHSTGTFSVPVRVGHIGSDAHANPSMMIDEDGYIYVFFGSHNNTMSTRRSASPYDITSWVGKASIATHTYPQAWQLTSGEIIHFYRGPFKKGYYRISTDGAASWSAATDFIDFGSDKWIYMMTIADNGSYPRTVHVTWTPRDGAGQPRRHVYYAKSTDGGTTWTKANGTPYTLPITEAQAEKIFDSGSDEVNSSDLQLDSLGNVYALYVTGSGNSWRWNVTKYNTASGLWENYTIGAAADHQFDTGAFVIRNDNDFRAYLPSVPTQANNDGGDIEEWQSTDQGETWAKLTDITSGSSLSHNFIRSVFNSDPDFRVFWGYGDSLSNAFSDVALYYYGENLASGAEINQNHVLRISGATNSVIRAKNFTGSDMIFEADVRPAGTSPGNSTLNVRVNGSGHNYNVRANNSNSRIFKYDGTFTQIGSTGPARDIVNFHKWTVKMHGNVVDFLWDDVALLSATDASSAFATGSVGARVSGGIMDLDNIRVRQYTATEPSASFGSETNIYSSAAPAINPTSANAQTLTSLSGFSSTEATNGGDIKYQISNNSGTTWYWYNSGWTSTSSGYSEANTANTINTNIGSLAVGDGSFLFKAFLNSDGSQLVQLSDVTLTYLMDSSSPTPSGGGGGAAARQARTRREQSGGGGGGGTAYSDTEAPSLSDVGIADEVTAQVSRQTGYINDPALRPDQDTAELPRRVAQLRDALIERFWQQMAEAERRQQEHEVAQAVFTQGQERLSAEERRLHRAAALAQSRIAQEPRTSPAQIAQRRGLLAAMVDGIEVLYGDVDIQAWYAPYVALLIEEEIAQGYKDDAGTPVGEFGVANPVTHAETLKMALEAAKTDIRGLPPPRNGSAQGTWAAAYVALGETLGLSVLSPDRDVHQPATRGEVIQTILQVLGIPTGIKIASPFADVASDYPHMPAITTAAAFGLVTGDTAPDGTPLGTFRPNDRINRAEVAKIIALTKALLP